MRNQIFLILLTVPLLLFGCSQSNADSIEKIAFKDCTKKNWTNKKFCTCYAKNLDSTLSSEEKKLYIRIQTVEGAVSSQAYLNQTFMDKISYGAPKKCYE